MFKGDLDNRRIETIKKQRVPPARSVPNIQNKEPHAKLIGKPSLGMLSLVEKVINTTSQLEKYPAIPVLRNFSEEYQQHHCMLPHVAEQESTSLL